MEDSSCTDEDYQDEEDDDEEMLSKTSESSKSISSSIIISGDDADHDHRTMKSLSKNKSKIITRSRRNVSNQSGKDQTIIINNSDNSIQSSSSSINDDEIGSKSLISASAGTGVGGTSKNPAWWYSHYKDEYDYRIDVGAKIDLLFQIIKRCSDIGDKMIIFSHSLISLDLIEKFLAQLHQQWTRVRVIFKIIVIIKLII